MRSMFAGWPVQVDREDGLGSLADGRLHLSGVDGVGLRVDVDEDRPRARLHNGLRGRDEGVRHSNDLITAAHAHSPQGQVQGIGAGTHAHGKADATVVGSLV